MLSLIRQIKDFLKDDFNLPHYLLTITLLLAMLYLNYDLGQGYGLGLNLELKVIRQKSLIIKWLLFSSLYLSLYFVCLASASFFKKEYSFWLEKDFYIKIFFIIAVYSFTRSHLPALAVRWAKPYFPETRNLVYITEILYYLSGLVVIVLMTQLIYRWKDRSLNNFYGMNLKSLKENMRIYISMVLVTIPGIFIAGQSPGLQRYYPTYKGSTLYQKYELPVWVDALVYEVSYMLNFVRVEMVFRGFLILAMQRILGKNVVLPMALFYSSIHLGKPMEEYISSFFGGYILGVVTYKHKSIFFGLILHMLLAISMEFVGFWY